MQVQYENPALQAGFFCIISDRISEKLRALHTVSSAKKFFADNPAISFVRRNFYSVTYILRKLL